MLALVASCLLAQTLSGCAPHGVAGSWQSAKLIGAVTSRVRYTFTDDGRYTSESEIYSKFGHLTTKESGRYTLEDDRITLNETMATINGAPIKRKTPVTETRTFRLANDNLILDDHKADKIVLTRTNT